MSLRKHGIYNDFTESLRPKKPDAGTVVKFRYANPIKGEYIYVETKNRPGTRTQVPFQYPRVTKLPMLSNFWDSVKKTWVKVGPVDSVDKDGNPVFNTSTRSMLWRNLQQTNGEIALTIGNKSDDTLFEYLSMASFVAGNPNRDESEPIILVRVDEEQEVADKRKDRELRIDALIKSRGMSDEEIERAAVVLGFGSKKPIDQLRNAVEDFAEKNPKGFHDRLSDPYLEAKAVCLFGLDNGTLFVDEKEKTLKWTSSGGAIIALTQTSRDEVAIEFAKYIHNEAEGERILRAIRDINDRVVKEKKPGRPRKEPA